jgi:hypothetical protein
MRWKTSKGRQYGEKRVIKRFAWFPVDIYPDTTVFLETYQVLQHFSNKRNCWNEIVDCWKDDAKYLNDVTLTDKKGKINVQ